MTALFNFDKYKLERFEDKIFSFASILGQILFPIGMIMLLFLPYVSINIIKNDLNLALGFLVGTLMFVLLGLMATALAMIDEHTVWHILNKKLKVFGYK